MNIVILGGTGFLGKHVLRMLGERGHAVTSLSRREDCNIMAFDRFRDRLRDLQPEAILNCAAHVGSVHYAIEYAADMLHDNTQILLNLYRAVREVCPKTKIVNPISNCSYPGDALKHCESEWFDGPIHDSVVAYGTPRRLIHTLAHCYKNQYGIRSVNWLIANAYGPGDYTDPNKVHALNGLIIRMMKGQRAGDRTFEIWGSGKPIREWVYIEDAARILVHSLDIDEQIYPLNLAQNKGWSVTEIAELAAKALDYPVTFTWNTKFADGAPVKVLDDRAFRERYSDFQFTPIDDGIRRSVDYYRTVL